MASLNKLRYLQEGLQMLTKFALLVFLLCAAGPAVAGALPTRVGACVVTTVEAVETRLEDGVTHQPIAGSGSAVRFANGGYQVSYETVPAIENSRKGDRVRMCFISRPLNCPPGDNRGKIYRTTNLRTHKSWRLRDSEHSCGGA
jgi:hypothetical protein